jgi:hypothetical protein
MNEDRRAALDAYRDSKIGQDIPRDRIARLVAQYGSDDRLVKAVNARLGTRLSRQMVIRWRTGKSLVSRQWAEHLAEFAGGVPDEWRSTPLPWKECVERRLTELERKMQELRPCEEELRAEVDAEPDAFLAELRAYRDEVIAWRELLEARFGRLEARFDRLDDEVAAIARRLRNGEP